ncbi:MAG: glycoside hydrolase family 2 protein [Microbacter sp.]
MSIKIWFSVFLALIATPFVSAHQAYELDKGWQCQNIKMVNVDGLTLSHASYPLRHWLPATVPGTVLNTLLNDKKIPDPFFGMNNKLIPDIYQVGRDFYTYWFVTDFQEPFPQGNEQVYLRFRGVNYSCDIFLNGHRVNVQRHYGMFLRQSYNITSLLAKSGKNRLAVLVFPPDPVGNPNGGQGGDGTIAKNVGIQYPAGWDWIQPVPDRNTGIWDKVSIVKTKGVLLVDPHIVTLVPGKRFPDALTQPPAIIKSSVTVENPTNDEIHGEVQFLVNHQVIAAKVDLLPKSSQTVYFKDDTLRNPRLWWPNGYGDQPLYETRFQFIADTHQLMDEITQQIGIRQIETSWDDHTKSRKVFVNGQPIFIKGGDWIISDEMLRFSPERYDAEIRFHKEMNLNLIRVWGGALTERPEFYAACDRYGLLVFQDLWFSGDCNGRWKDPTKKDDQWTRRNYPDNHALALASMIDQIKMLRNHPSLAFWCGGNEITPPNDLLRALEDSILPNLDGTRYFFEYSNTDSMSYNSIGGNGDGPYGIQHPDHFWNVRTFPFNSEVGSVGMGDIESLKRFMPQRDLVIPNPDHLDSVWEYHKFIGYGNHIERYGTPTSLADYCEKAQLVNYDQYRALAEGFSAHLWDWYTGFIIWKTQNPWTALRGQMYDYYLDPNAGLYGLQCGAEPLHVMCNPTTGMILTVNNTFQPYRNIMLREFTIDMNGKMNPDNTQLIYLSPSSVQSFFSVEDQLEALRRQGGGFLQLQLLDAPNHLLSENLYWISDTVGHYLGLSKMPKADVTLKTQTLSDRSVQVTLTNPASNPIAFFIHITVIDPKTGERILPVFYDKNWLSVLPGETRVVSVSSAKPFGRCAVQIKGWNVNEQRISLPFGE